MGPLICCLDDSDGARHSLLIAQRLAPQLGLELMLLHIEPPTEMPGVSAAPAGHQRLHEEEMRNAESLLARLAREAGLGPDLRFRTAIGPPAESIVAICAEEKAELVVLGSRGRGGLTSALLGSVSSEVAAKAPCPCVIVPPTAHG
jgi:nucleotide-binding universal stress UspA family protein